MLNETIKHTRVYEFVISSVRIYGRFNDIYDITFYKYIHRNNTMKGLES